MSVHTRKKLIEVALPLVAINAACAREKSIRHGHPSTLHLWWARRPLAAARAVIFAQMVDDPSSWPELFPTEKAQEKERKRLFKIIEDMVLWENTTNEEVMQRARDAIWDSWRRTCAENADHPRAKELFNRDKLPAFHDPFAGGGSLPLEAQRLGLEAYASDLNPVAVLICKAMIEIPPKFAGRAPINPEARNEKRLLEKQWRGAEGLAEDVRYYGKWMRDEAKKRIGHLYPKIEITAELAKDRQDLKHLVGKKLAVIAWLWARTVKCPNPACGAQMPLVHSFWLSTRSGKKAWTKAVFDRNGTSARFEVQTGEGAPPEGTVNRRGAKCIRCSSPVPLGYLRAEGKAKRMGAQLMTIVAGGERTRIFLPPSAEQEEESTRGNPTWEPQMELPHNPFALRPPLYGFYTFADLFTHRQLVALSTFTDLVGEARDKVQSDIAVLPQQRDSLLPSNTDFLGSSYSDAIATYLGLAASKLTDRNSSVAGWDVGSVSLRSTFARQAIPMTWDFCEANPFETIGSFEGAVEWITRVLILLPASPPGLAEQLDASAILAKIEGPVISADPPYYDNIDYADLSDFFYVWLRRGVGSIYPTLFSTVLSPKAQELVATPYRFEGDRSKAERHFLDGLGKAFRLIRDRRHPAYPVSVFYAFKQSEESEEEGSDSSPVASTGWETMLEGLMNAGFQVTGTFPIRTELANRPMAMDMNALASSIVLVCRVRSEDAPSATRAEFLRSLKTELPSAVAQLQRGNIAPVDLAQAAIGPGMGVYTRYAKVLDAQGHSLSVRGALALVNQILDEVLTEQEGDFDADTRWALAWFEQFGFDDGDFGVAETLSKAKNTSVNGMKDAGFLDPKSKGGKVRLLRPGELDPGWDPATDPRLTAWETVHHLVRALGTSEAAAADLLSKLANHAEQARELAYRLYAICERKRRAQEALAYNGLVLSWPEIARLATETGKTLPSQASFLEKE